MDGFFYFRSICRLCVAFENYCFFGEKLVFYRYCDIIVNNVMVGCDYVKDQLKVLLNKLFVIAFFLILVISTARTLFYPTDYNMYENRYANKLSVPSLAAVLDGSFQSNVEDSLNDQIPFSQLMKKGYNFLTKNIINPIISRISDDNKIYLRFFGMNLFDEHLVYEKSDFDTLKDALDIKADNYNVLIEANPDVMFYAYFIEKDTEINFLTGEKTASARYLLSQLDIPESNSGIFEINNYAEFSKYFYKTDHHWNHMGSYEGYRQLVSLLCEDGHPMMYDSEITVFDGFRGSKAIRTGSRLVKDQFCAYSFLFPEYVITANGIEVSDYGMQQEFFEADNIKTITYGDFYGFDAGEVIFDNGNNTGENILLIGESFDNAILKLLASHFDKTFSVDLRNYEYYMGREFDFNQYLKDNEIDKVLFIGNNDFWTGTDFMMESK